MARSDLLISLVKAGAAGDKNLLRVTVDALVAEERAKSHHVVAERLVKAVQSIAVTPPTLNNISFAKNDGKEYYFGSCSQIKLGRFTINSSRKNRGRSYN